MSAFIVHVRIGASWGKPSKERLVAAMHEAQREIAREIAERLSTPELEIYGDDVTFEVLE